MSGGGPVSLSSIKLQVTWQIKSRAATQNYNKLCAHKYKSYVCTCVCVCVYSHMQLQIMVWMLVPPPVPLHTHRNIHLPLRKPQSLSFRRLGDISPFPSHTYINQSAYFF